MTRLSHFLAALALLVSLIALVACDLLIGSDRKTDKVDPEPVCYDRGHGDINCNDIPYEIADAVMFTNYFINGDATFGSHVELSKAESNANGDCARLSVADLVYMIRVITGDASPGFEPRPVLARITHINGALGVNWDMGAAFILMEGNVQPTLLASNMEMLFRFDGENTRILVYSISYQHFTGDFLRADGRIVSTEFATSQGHPVVDFSFPTTFQVSQNYPNPFYPATKIRIQIPNGGPWSLVIRDSNGHRVFSRSGISETGWETVVWGASNLGSGHYFYTVTAGGLSITKKATLAR